MAYRFLWRLLAVYFHRFLWRFVVVLFLCVASSVRADTYDAMRVNWFNNLTGGTAYDATDPDVAGATASLTASANAY